MGGGRGAICRDCYNIRQNDRYPYIRTRKYEPCRICGTLTRSLAGICVSRSTCSNFFLVIVKQYDIVIQTL